MVSFQQSFPHFPQWKRWMDKSGEEWWKMEGVQGNNDMNWGIQKFGHKMGIRRNFNG